jgi:diguanylate cyclase (GGDEF)-like protein
MSQMYEPLHAAFQAVAQAEAGASSALSDVTVMMVDDEPMMIEVTQTYLEDAGYHRFVGVSDPRLALATARTRRPGLILLDLMMPELNGFEVLTQLRQDPVLRFTPVIVLTASSDPASKLRALELGATEFLAKPVDESELKIRVRNSLAFRVYQDHLVNDDALTGLPNRRVFVDRLRTAMAHAAAHPGSRLALLQVNLDRFRQLNDTLGHRAGDELLVAAAQRMRAVCASPQLAAAAARGCAPVLARLGGDEFGLLLPELGDDRTVEAVAQEVVAQFSLPFRLEGQDLFVTASIGIALHPGDARDDAALLRNAGAAMKHVKGEGRNGFQFYVPELNSASRERLKLETDLRRALERNELVLHYQPKVDLTTNLACGAEALMRWRHPELGLVPPARFIPMAEETGLIVELGEWVIHRAAQQLSEWRHRHGLDLPLSVNVARHGLASGTLQSVVAQALSRHAVPRGRLILELTESMLMDRVDTMTAKLHALRELGVELSIDDFGTGYSSMSYLKRFPLQELKIDRSFVQDVADDPTDAAIVRALVSLGHSLHMRVIAEGVETVQQRDTLLRLGCDAYQGFLFSKALPPDEFVRRVLTYADTMPAPL